MTLAFTYPDGTLPLVCQKTTERQRDGAKPERARR